MRVNDGRRGCVPLPWRAAFLIAPGLLRFAACDGTTEPDGMPAVATINTVAIQARGAVDLDTVVPALAGFQFVDGEDAGIYIAGQFGGRSSVRPVGFPALPWAPAFGIQLPGRPEAGTLSLGRWDPLRHGEITGPPWVSRTPSVTFGDHPAAVLQFYASLEGGTVEIESITLPSYRAIGTPGTIRGRLASRAMADQLLAGLDSASVPPGEVDVSAEFWVELDGWHTGRAVVSFADGALAGISSAQLTGSGSTFVIGADDDQRLVVGVVDDHTPSGPIEIWFGTKLHETGTVALEPIHPAEIHDPKNWPDHFVAGTIRGADVGSVSGFIDLIAYEPSTAQRWGEAMGRARFEVTVDGLDGADTSDRATGEMTFRVPLRDFVQVGASND